MLPSFIIEQIRKREEEEAQKESPVLPLQLPDGPPPPPRPDEGGDKKGERGVVIIDVGS